MSGCPLESAGAAGGNSSTLPGFWLRHESPCPCRVMPAPPMRGQRWGQRLCCCARPAGVTRSSEMALTTAPIVPLLSKPPPHWLPSKDLWPHSHSAKLQKLLNA
ncbi:uncharacterized protein [Dermacentor andersoni]|uniref:uncharacterized protein n=1 Tax=Dermacentor andersoni TaxID=34620 RepID=UPI002417A4F2|nr:uncharacterized protein LOC129381288 [Dermacentor andersoni]XP_054919991.1 uncharacterized protein LOC129381288 [Dermacentor andersoni]